MDSEQIKSIVSAVNSICNSEDINFQSDRTKELANDLINNLLHDCLKSPQFAIAINEHLKDHGFDLSKVSNDFSERFKLAFSRTLERMDERSLVHIKKISMKLFA